MGVGGTMTAAEAAAAGGVDADGAAAGSPQRRRASSPSAVVVRWHAAAARRRMGKALMMRVASSRQGCHMQWSVRQCDMKVCRYRAKMLCGPTAPLRWPDV